MPTRPKSPPVIRGIDPNRILHPSLDERPSEISRVAGAGIWLADREMNVLWMNEVMEGIYGPLSRQPDVRCFHVFRGKDSPCRLCLVREAFESRRIVTGFVSRTTPDNVRRCYQVIETPLLDEENRTSRVLEVVLDVTEQRRIEQRLIQEEKLSALGELAASLAHEIKNPLNSMVINTEVLKGRLSQLKKAEAEPLRRYLDVLSTEIRRLDKVIERVLSYVKPREGTYERVELKTIVSHVISLTEAQARRQRVRVHADLPADLPAMEGVPDHLIQVFLNLFLNSFQAMPKGGSVTVKGKRGRSGTIVVSVTDTGSGIPRKDYRKIFDLYFSTKEKGSGLGLPLVQRLVTAHGGAIAFRSRVRHGTTFTLTFPTA